MQSAKANQKNAIATAAAIKSALLLDTDVAIGAWWEDERILPLTEFSKNYLKFPLWEKQAEDLERFVGATSDDARTLLTQKPPTEFNCGVLAYGKGSGKGSMAAVFIVWVVYLLLSLNDPQGFLKMPRDEAIDIALASPTLKQTRNITFSKVKSRLKDLHWMHRRLRSLGITDTARYLRTATEAADFIELPNKIRIHNLPLKATSAEGFNLIAFVVDELAGLESEAMSTTATDLFNTFQSSGKTRFNKAWLGLVTGFPRSTTDPQEQLIQAHEAGLFPELFVSRRPTWEVHPRLEQKDFAKEFVRNPEDAWAKFGAQPRAAVSGFFRSPELIVANCSGGDAELLARQFSDAPLELIQMLAKRMPDPIKQRSEFGDVELDRYGFPQLHPWFRGKSETEYFAHIDIGLTRDSAGFAIGHLEVVNTKAGDRALPVLDLVCRWRAAHFTDFGEIYRWNWQGIGHYTETVTAAEVDLKTLTDFLIWLNKARAFTFGMVTVDGYNSAQLRQTLFQQSIPCLLHVVTKEDYDELKGAIYTRQLQYRCDRILYHELAKLIVKNGKVEAPRTKAGGDASVDSHKDEADCAAAVVSRLVRSATHGLELMELDPIDERISAQLEQGQVSIEMTPDQLSEVQKKVWSEFFSQ